MSGSFVFGQQNAVPRRPFFLPIPSHQHKIVEISPGAHNTLPVPDFFNQKANVFFLKQTRKCLSIHTHSFTSLLQQIVICNISTFKKYFIFVVLVQY